MPSTDHIKPSSDPRVVSDELSLISVVTAVLRQRLLILGSALLLATAVIVNIARRPDTYTSSASFVLQPSQGGSGLSGLAAQFGLAGSDRTTASNPKFYQALIGSRVLLSRIANADFTISTDSGPRSGTLIDLFGIRGGSQLSQTARAVSQLQRTVMTDLDDKTGGVRVSVHASNPALAKVILDRLLIEVNTFNLETRQSQASFERKYAEGRLASAREELRVSEDALQQFLESNRATRSPQLSLSEERLRRTISVKQEVYLSLAQAYEQARLGEVRDTPIITLFEPPLLPLGPDNRRYLFFSIVAFLTGALIGAFAGLIREYIRLARKEHIPELDELAEEVHATAAWVLAPLRRVRRLRGR